MNNNNKNNKNNNYNKNNFFNPILLSIVHHLYQATVDYDQMCDIEQAKVIN